MTKNNLKTQLESINPGDLICCAWSDASVGKSSGSGMSIEVPVKSWGVYVGLIGDKVKHIVLAQNSFRYSDGLFDLDYTAIPISWTTDVSVLIKDYFPREDASKLINSFIVGGHRLMNAPRIFRRALAQRRLSVDGRHY